MCCYTGKTHIHLKIYLRLKTRPVLFFVFKKNRRRDPGLKQRIRVKITHLRTNAVLFLLSGEKSLAP